MLILIETLTSLTVTDTTIASTSPAHIPHAAAETRRGEDELRPVLVDEEENRRRKAEDQDDDPRNVGSVVSIAAPWGRALGAGRDVEVIC